MSAPRVSILIPTLEAERDLKRLLPALAAQQVEGGIEIRAVDSDSGDGTRELLEAAGAHVSRIERHEFRHGATRNRLGREARGEFLLFLSQDALPAADDFVRAMIAPLAQPEVAASSARILPHPGDDPLTARTVLAAPQADEHPALRRLEPRASLRDTSPTERALHLRFDNVASCIRASVFRTIPFPDVPFGEDAAWALEALAGGWSLAHAADAVVHHAHRYTPAQAFARYRVDAALHRRLYDRRLRPSLVSVLRGILHEVREDARYLRRHGGGLRHLLRSPALRGAQVLGQYFGSRGWNPRPGRSASGRYS